MADNLPTIQDAKDLATKRRRKAVIVLSFGGGNFHLASYGMTRKLCDDAGDVLEQINALLAVGTITIPDSLSGD